MKNRIIFTLLIALISLVSCTSEPQLTSSPQSEEKTPAKTSLNNEQPAESLRIDPTLNQCSGKLTSHNQEGPFYKSGSPERESLIDEGMAGNPIQIMGRVFDQDCNALPGVKLDFWLADVDGEYDNVGYTLRGYQLSDRDGYYAIESIEPTPYTGRPSHIHVKVYAQDGRELLTTQMYFLGAESSADVLNSPDLLVTYLEPDTDSRQQVLFNFVVQD